MEHARPPVELNMDGGPANRAEQWKKWRQQFILFTKASGVSTEKSAVQASLLINLIGPEGFDIYRTFTFEKEGDRDDYSILLEKFDAYFGAKVNTTLVRYKFFTRNQEEGETIQQYVTSLRLLSKDCKFNNLQEELIKDKIVCGVRSGKVRDRLLRHEDLDLEKAVGLCQAEEASQESNHQLGTGGIAGSSVALVDSVQRSRNIRRGGGASGRWSGPRGVNWRDMRGARFMPCAGCGAEKNCVEGQCPALRIVCYICGKQGHVARVCKMNMFNKNKGSVKKLYDIDCDESSSDSDRNESFYISVIREGGSEDWFETLSCDRGEERFKLDTGADINVMSYKRFAELGFDDNRVKKRNIRLESYSGDLIPVKGICNLPWSYKHKMYDLRFAIADMSCQSVLGRKSCEEVGLVKRIHEVNLTEYEELFRGVGCLPGKYHIVTDGSVRPVVSATRKIPLGLRDQLAKELKKMEKMGIIRKVNHPTPWVHALVIAAKKNNGIRICLDPRELNRAVQRAHFQLPTITELAAQLNGAKYFSVLDATSGFWAIQLDEESVDLCTFATPFGRYQFLRLPFGINCASEVFHAKIRQLLEDLQGTDSFVDDIIVWGKTKEEHDRRLNALFNRARVINLKFNKEKCRIGVKEVKYLGHLFNENGMQPDPSKTRAIKEMPIPNDRKSLERFLGAVNYLAKFIPNYSEYACPLTKLLRKDIEWCWEESEQGAFDKLKECVSCAPVLALYDVSRPVVVSVDASGDALGAVLSQDGRPVEYASRTLTDAQRRYAQIEKELLAIVFGCERFHQYIFGKSKVIVESDHKPLESVFKKPLMSVPARLQRMMLRIQCYDLVVCYKPGKYMYIPDTLSRAPLPDLYSEEVAENVLCQVQLIVNNLPMSNNKLSLIKKETKQDRDLCKILEYINAGWPDNKCNLRESLKIYWPIKDELFVVDGVIFRENVVVIPTILRAQMLEIIHEGHLGIDRCKRRARQVLFWPNMSRDIEKFVKLCNICRENVNSLSREPMIPMTIPSLPWTKVGSDLFEYRKEHYLIVVDYYSNYIEVSKLMNISSKSVINAMKDMFSRHGIPELLVSDNGTQYTSREFKMFAKEWGFDHVTSSPNYPQANGKSERAVQTIKSLLIKAINSGTDFHLALLNFRNTPRQGLSSPAQLLMSRRLRCKLPVSGKLMEPKIVDSSEYKTMIDKQIKSKIYYDQRAKPLPPLNSGDNVICKNGTSRMHGTVVGMAHTPRSYIIENNDGAQYRRNRRHLIRCASNAVRDPNNCEEGVCKYDGKVVDDTSSKSTVECGPSTENTASSSSDTGKACPKYVRISGRLVRR